MFTKLIDYLFDDIARMDRIVFVVHESLCVCVSVCRNNVLSHPKCRHFYDILSIMIGQRMFVSLSVHSNHGGAQLAHSLCHYLSSELAATNMLWKF